MKDKLIAVCGLDCSNCEARVATIYNDDELREKVAKEWSKLNGVEISKESINCHGCRMDGRKTPFCDKLCPIRNCAKEHCVDTCGECEFLDTCDTIKMIIDTNEDALERLKDKEK